MPLDPLIPLSVKPAQIEDPLAAYGKVLQIKGAQQQQQANAQRLQEGELDLQQKQRALAYQKTFTDSLQKHTTKNPDGSLATDWSGVQGDITNAGYGAEALGLSAERAKVQKAGLDLLHAQNTADADRVKAVGQQLGALPSVDESAPPEVQQVQKAAFNAAAPQAIANLVKGGQMSQEQGAQVVQQLQQSGGWTPQIGQYVKQSQLAALTADQQIQHVQKGIDAARQHQLDSLNKPKIEAETTKLQTEVADKLTSDAAVTLSNAKDAADYTAKLAKLDPKIAAKFPTNADPTDEDVKDKILTSGMNADQLARHTESVLNGASMRAAREATKEYREDSLAFRREMAADRKFANNKEAAKAKTQILSLQRQEEPLWGQAAQLQHAVENGQIFVPDKGAPTPMSNKLGASQDPAAKQALIEDMKTRLEATKERLKSTINSKYDTLEDAGGGKVSVSREDALAAIDRIGQKKAAPAAAAQKSAPTAAGGKKLDTTKATEYLQKAGGDKVRATALAKADGYTQ